MSQERAKVAEDAESVKRGIRKRIRRNAVVKTGLAVTASRLGILAAVRVAHEQIDGIVFQLEVAGRS